METAKIQKLNPNARIPTHGSQQSAGYDLYACIEEGDVLIKAGTTEKIPTGIAITPPKGFFGAIFARSGLAINQGLRPANCIGICDYDYTGEYIVALHNDNTGQHSLEDKIIKNGDRIAQLVFLPYSDVKFEVVDSLEETKRGGGGLGSTGK